MPVLEAKLVDLGYGPSSSLASAKTITEGGRRNKGVQNKENALEVRVKSSHSPVFKFSIEEKPMLEVGPLSLTQLKLLASSPLHTHTHTHSDAHSSTKAC